MKPTHAVTFNGLVDMNLSASVRPIDLQIERSIARLDGLEHFSYALWTLPKGKSIGENIPAEFMGTYLQALGSSQAMSIEIRSVLGTEIHHEVLGHRGEFESTHGTHISVGASTITVSNLEVFGLSEASAIFYQYFQDHTISDKYTRRPLGSARS